MTESRACPECGAEVPIGRLSCGACGALLAVVEGRQVEGVPESTRSLPAPSASTSPGTADPRLARPEASAPADSTPAPAASQAPAPIARVSPAAGPPGPNAPSLAPLTPPPPPMPPLPGAYLPPSSVMQGLPVTPAVKAATTPPSALGTRAHAPAPAPSSPAPAPDTAARGEATRAPVLEVPFALAPGLGPRLVAAGAALGVVAFVLPWIGEGGVVIGGSFGGGYFATWGLAAIGNVVPFILAWASLGLAVLPNRAPRVATLGVLPVFLGGVLAGDAWTYLTSPAGMALGTWVLAASAILLVAGGSLDLRHGEAAA